MNSGVMLNVYPDSCGGNLKNLVTLLKKDDFKDVFSYIYILPSLFKSDLDRGFSIESYDINPEFASKNDLEELQKLNISLKLDFVLNHLSVRSPQFKDLLEKGDDSIFIDTFIDWNKFWAGKGELSNEGYIVPSNEYLSKLFMRKPGLPILKIPFPDNTYRFYWNTFYQQKIIELPTIEELEKIEGVTTNISKDILKNLEDGINSNVALNSINFSCSNSVKDRVINFIDREHTSYLGQMDLNGESSTVWEFYKDTFSKLSKYGAKIVRLDAFAYLHKQAGLSNFFNTPGTWDYLERIKEIADSYNLILLPEIHSKHEESIHAEISQKGYPIYDFFFPGLVINAIEKGDSTKLIKWIKEIITNGYKTVNMLGCHDGIPLLDVKGLLNETEISELMDIVKSRGGRIKDLYDADGKKISYYQINATFFSALGENEKKLLLARAIQIFMPGIPDVWYLDIFAGKNDYIAADTIGHKDINRTNLTNEDLERDLKLPIVQKQLELLKLRNTKPAFGFNSDLIINELNNSILDLTWINGSNRARLIANLKTFDFTIN